jgi:hypothetical protein
MSVFGLVDQVEMDDGCVLPASAANISTDDDRVGGA